MGGSGGSGSVESVGVVRNIGGSGRARCVACGRDVPYATGLSVSADRIGAMHFCFCVLPGCFAAKFCLDLLV